MADNSESFSEALSRLPRFSDEDMARVRFIDVEASGLHKTSYPIEIAWCGFDLRPVSLLIKPLAQWGLDDWSPESERVHGISRQTLLLDGVEAKLCAVAMAEAMSGCLVYSDAPAFDARWLMTLFGAVDVRPGFNLHPIEDIQAVSASKAVPAFTSLQELVQIEEDIARFYKHTHRAGDDCLRMAAMCRGLYDAAWREAVLNKKRAGLPPL